MKVIFESHQDKFRLQNLCIFAQHKQELIDKVAAISEDHAKQYRRENEEWARLEHKLVDCQPGVEYTL